LTTAEIIEILTQSMEAFLFILVLLCFPPTGVVIYLYLQSSFSLLKLVQQDDALWKSLDEPRQQYIKENQGGFQTIKPIGPWLAWIWSGTATNTNPQLVHQLRKTRFLLKASLALFLLTGGLIAALALTEQATR
jgi:hypothetical protein